MLLRPDIQCGTYTREKISLTGEAGEHNLPLTPFDSTSDFQERLRLHSRRRSHVVTVTHVPAIPTGYCLLVRRAREHETHDQFIRVLRGGLSPRTYADTFAYDAAGRVRQERFATDTPLYNKHLYNARGQLAEIRVGLYPITDPDSARSTSWQRGAIINDYSSTAWGVSGGGSDNNGNLLRQKVFIPSDDAAGYEGRVSLIEQAYGYDYLNRLTRVEEASGGQTR